MEISIQRLFGEDLVNKEKILLTTSIVIENKFILTATLTKAKDPNEHFIHL